MPTATSSTTGRSRRRLIRSRGTATSSAVASTMLTSTLSTALIVVSPTEPVLRSRKRSSDSSASTAATETPSSTKTPTSTPRSTSRRTTRLPGCWLKSVHQPLRGADRLHPADPGEDQDDQADHADGAAALGDLLGVQERQVLLEEVGRRAR